MKKQFLILALMILSIPLCMGQKFNTLEMHYHDKPIVEMELNGKKTWVLLDTGSDISVLNLKAKDKYEFHAHQDFNQTIKVAGFGTRHNELHQVTNAELYFGDVKLRSVYYAYDISHIAASIRARTDKTITAIIGTNLMRDYGFVIDMGTQKVSMTYKVKKKDRNQDDNNGLFTIAKRN
ncbi:retropepsin-like domain-containing protein [Reichenbachiella ulvae]|uniref:Retropepsin-like domain-containing protein n=1 Tax=Reichenbachiella ulvae TaxID=2980104 RepID=A0ABT3CNQ4_9BACT|nr:retropepsin-like domain-containing protein [Reichenbachiella ulvae]MCV9385345.1 retropepsin-like domain-containing protein [Reichenbachiella ulvae]